MRKNVSLISKISHNCCLQPAAEAPNLEEFPSKEINIKYRFFQHASFTITYNYQWRFVQLLHLQTGVDRNRPRFLSSSVYL
jgi:hypothetical protein